MASTASTALTRNDQGGDDMLTLAQVVIEAHMTETDGEVYCDCGLFLGSYVEMEGRTFLKNGNIISWSTHGSCICGRSFHWAMTDKLLEQIISRSKSMKYLEALE